MTSCNLYNPNALGLNAEGFGAIIVAMEVTGGQIYTFQLEIGKSYCITCDTAGQLNGVATGRPFYVLFQHCFVAAEQSCTYRPDYPGFFHITEIK